MIEVDGSQHADSEYDRQRDRYMNAEGWSRPFLECRWSDRNGPVIETIVAIFDGRLTGALDAHDLRFVPGRVDCPSPQPSPRMREEGTCRVPRSPNGSDGRILKLQPSREHHAGRSFVLHLPIRVGFRSIAPVRSRLAI
ncbi:hypothetical protein [Neorhizobium alkalisoli]|uniref:hypothetical protein n=1 Tax=Neorhizobium alkalisoli TaxID=528178 RepID=UPI00131A3005